MTSSEWRSRKLGDVTSWTSGGTPRKGEPSYWYGDIPWISAVSMKSTRLTDSALKITEAGLKKGSRLAERHSILLLVRGSELHKRIPIGIASRPVAFNQDVKAVKAKEELLPTYLLYWLLANEPLLLSKVEHTGIGAGKLDIDVMKDLSMNLPPITEQRAIVRILGTLDDKSELNRQMSETLEAMAWTIFKSWFVDFDPVRAKSEGRDSGLPKHVADLFPDRFEDSELGEIPAGWRNDNLGNLIELAYGKALKQSVRKAGNIAVFGSNGQVGWHDERLVEGPGIVVGRKGNPGFVIWSATDFFPIDTTFYVVPRDPRLSLHFLFYALKTHNLPSLAADSAVPGLNRTLVYQNQQIVPSASVVNVFDSVVELLFQRMHDADEESRTLAAIRDVLLPKLVSGEIRTDTS